MASMDASTSQIDVRMAHADGEIESSFIIRKSGKRTNALALTYAVK
jgi:hypothetical protein